MSPKGLLQVEVVSADRLVWEGTAEMLIARTTEGDIGIMPGHEPLMSGLVACAVEVITGEGDREVIAVDGGFLSVSSDRVSILSQFASLSNELSASEVDVELAKVETLVNEGEVDEDTMRRYHLAQAQQKVVRKLAE